MVSMVSTVHGPGEKCPAGRFSEVTGADGFEACNDAWDGDSEKRGRWIVDFMWNISGKYVIYIDLC